MKILWWKVNKEATDKIIDAMLERKSKLSTSDLKKEASNTKEYRMLSIASIALEKQGRIKVTPKVKLERGRKNPNKTYLRTKFEWEIKRD